MTQEEVNAHLITGMGRDVGASLAEAAAANHRVLQWLIDATVSQSLPRSQKAAYCLRQLSELYPGVLAARKAEIRTWMDAANHDSIRRDLLKCVLNLKDSELSDSFTDRCFGWLTMPGVDTAVKYNSIAVLVDVTKRWPDLIPEVIASIEGQHGLVTDAFDRYTQKIILRLRKRLLQHQRT